MFGFGPKVESTTVEEVLDKKLSPIIDVREPEEYNTGHMPGAKNVPMMGLMMNPSQFLEKGKTYYIICESGARSQRTCQSLIKDGYTVVNIEGGTSAYRRMR